MTVHRCVYLTCTNCGNQFISEFGPYGETAMEVRNQASREGWVRKRVKNGSFWDFCKRCWEERE